MCESKEMPLHPVIAAAISDTKDLPGYEALPIGEARERAKRGYVYAIHTAVAAAKSQTVSFGARNVGIRLYRPNFQPSLPAVVFFHGSGFCLLDLDTHDQICRFLCRNANTVVISVDYRLAPEHPFPAGSDDCFDVTEWAFANASYLGIDAEKIVVAGDSAGAHMAIVVALRRRMEAKNALAGKLLFYPVTDHYDACHESYSSFGSGFGLTANQMRWSWDKYVADRASSEHPLVSPNRADLNGLPPTYVQVAEYDVLRDEGVEFSQRLAHASVETICVTARSLNHGYLRWIGQIEEATALAVKACEWLETIWQRRPAEAEKPHKALAASDPTS